MSGLLIAEEAHTVLVLNPASISGGVSGLIFSMKNATKANILIAWGALAATQGAVTLAACSDLAGSNATPIPFDLWQQNAAGAGNDVLGARQSVTAAGYTPSDLPGIVDVLHVQEDQLPAGLPCIKLSIADGTNADYACAIAILTGLGYSGASNPSATV